MSTASDENITANEDLPGEATRRSQDVERQVGLALRRHTESVLPALINRQEHLLVREHLAAELALGFEDRRAALEMVLESRLQTVREACNHVLVTGKSHNGPWHKQKWFNFQLDFHTQNRPRGSCRV